MPSISSLIRVGLLGCRLASQKSRLKWLKTAGLLQPSDSSCIKGPIPMSQAQWLCSSRDSAGRCPTGITLLACSAVNMYLPTALGFWIEKAFDCLGIIRSQFSYRPLIISIFMRFDAPRSGAFPPNITTSSPFCSSPCSIRASSVSMMSSSVDSICGTLIA